MDLILRGATRQGDSTRVDIGIDEGRIVQIGRIPSKGIREIEANGRLVIPGFVDPHIHLDKILTADRYNWTTRSQQGLDPTLLANQASEPLKREFTEEDVYRRARTAVEMLAYHGTLYIRANVDVDQTIGLNGLKGVLRARDACRDLVDMQIVAFAQNGIYAEDGNLELLRTALESGAGVIGGLPEIDRDDAHAHLDRIFELATEYEVDVEAHIDQSRVARPFNLPYFLEKVEQQGFQGRALAIHCFGLAFVPPDIARQTLEQARENAVSIAFTPYEYVAPRGKAPLGSGVNTAYCTDNIRDTWQPFDGGDQLQTGLFFARTSLMRSTEELNTVLEMATHRAAQAIGLKGYGIKEGHAADLVVLDASTASEAVIGQSEKLLVLKRGEIIRRSARLRVQFP